MDAFQLLGSAAAALLARGISLELDRAVLGPGRCARTRLGDLAVMLRPLEENGYELLVDRSEARFLLDWLSDSTAGFRPIPESLRSVDAVPGGAAATLAEL